MQIAPRGWGGGLGEVFVQLTQSVSADVGEAVPAQNGPSVLVGLVGRNIQRSRTPRMHEVEGARHGMRYTYQLIDAAMAGDSALGIAQILEAAALFGFAGLNITYPYKQTIMPHLDEIDDGAARVGAVNTVVLRKGKSRGYNTDLWGFGQGFDLEMGDAPRQTVVQLGAGGAGSAVANALVGCGVGELLIADLDHARATALVARLNGKGANAAALSLESIGTRRFDGIVNATPIGMDATPGMPVDRSVLRPDIWVADIIYFPLETELLASARALGCRTLSGASMAVFQAVKAFELFTGRPADADAMRATFDGFETRVP